MTTVRLTKYEIARVIGSRATILARGAEPNIDIGDMTNVIEIAKAEFEQNKIPFVIEREFPNKTVQRIIIGQGPPRVLDDE